MSKWMAAASRTKQSLARVTLTPPTTYQDEYLLGVRGVLVIECFLWMLFQTFIPAILPDSDNTSGPLYQIILRKTIGVIFWNDNLIYASFIFLSARSIAIPFLVDPSKSRIARAVWCRGLALCLPTAVSLAITKIAFSVMGEQYMWNFKQQSDNATMAVPYMIPNAFAYFNSVFNIFWIGQSPQWPLQAASTAFPTQTLWIISAIYQQSYTVYMTMVIIPYTRNAWRVKGAIFMVITAWWVQSWAWYTITGLLIADAVINMDYKTKAKKGIPIPKTSRHCPTWVPCAILMFVGFFMQFLWTAWDPSLANGEYLVHTPIYGTPGLNTKDNGRYPQPRIDSYLIILGGLLLLERSDFLQRMLKFGPLRYLGSRSLSYFLIQGIIMYTMGIKLFSHLRFGLSASFSAAAIAVLVSTLAVVVPLAELFYRLVELPSKVFTHAFYDWMTKD